MLLLVQKESSYICNLLICVLRDQWPNRSDVWIDEASLCMLSCAWQLPTMNSEPPNMGAPVFLGTGDPFHLEWEKFGYTYSNHVCGAFWQDRSSYNISQLLMLTVASASHAVSCML